MKSTPTMRISNAIQNLSIGKKLVMLVGLLLAGISLFIFWYFPSALEHRYMDAISQKTHSIVNMTAYAIAPAFVFDDKEAIRESFQAAKQNKDLVYFVAADTSGRLVFSYNRAAADSAKYLERVSGRNISPDGKVFGDVSPVIFQNRELGKVYLALSLEDLETEIRNSRETIALLSLGVFLFGGVFILLIAAFITVPLQKMVTTAEHIAAGNLSERAPVESGDEVGVLAATFNGMVDRLTLTQRELAEVNRTLEERVEDRTRALRQEITEREEAQRVLRRQATAMQASIDGMAILGVDEKYIYTNAAHAAIYGFDSPAELLDRPWTILYDENELELFRTTIMPSLRQNGLWVGEAIGKKKDGTTFPQELSLNTLSDGGLVCVVRDITTRKRAEEATNRLRRAVEQTEDVVFMTGLDGTIDYVNPAFEKLYGFRAEEVLGKTPRILKSGHHEGDEYEGFWRQISSGLNFRGELINKCKNGRLVTVEVSVSPVYNGESKPTGFIAVQRDVTYKKQEERRRMDLEAQLAQAQKMESIGTLAGGIAHDFNNILAIILGHVSLLEERKSQTQNISNSLASINSAVQRGAGLVKQILTFARKTEVLREPIRVNSVVDEVVTMLRQTFPKTITLESSIAETDPIAEADHTQLHQTLLNLCVNARDAMQQGGSILIATGEVPANELQRKFPGTCDSPYVRIAVTDTGSGMDQQTLRRIFDPFFTTKEKGKGTGLGLAVVDGIVKGHNGFIDVQSEVGRGTTFSLYFPLSRSGKKDVQIQKTCESSAKGGTETILIVEDEEMLRTLLESLLASQGYTVLTADDGEKAVDTYRNHQNEVAVVVSDLGLPKLGGQDAFLKIREINPSAKVILASGYVEPQVRAKLISAGAKGVISKPYIPREILMQIREAIEK